MDANRDDPANPFGISGDVTELLGQMTQAQSAAMSQIFGAMLPGSDMHVPDLDAASGHWEKVSAAFGKDFASFVPFDTSEQGPAAALADPGPWLSLVERWWQSMPMAHGDQNKAFWEESLQLWEGVLGQYGIGPKALEGERGDVALPRKDRRFADPKWSEQPLFALLHQTYLLFAERIEQSVDSIDGLDEEERERLAFVSRAMVEAMSPAHFPITNPVVLERTLETRGENLKRGMEHLMADLAKGQLTHVDPEAFTLGENLATTPGKVVHETPLYQLIQYSPTTSEVFETPLVIFPPWINRFYILDLNAKKSFIAWCVEQGITTYIVSWKSADETMADIVWDDYVKAQVEAIDHVRERLDVESVHTIGYCVAGTTLAATLAMLARRGEADRVKSATFFTAQVDFEKAGELKCFVDDQQLAALEQLGQKGYTDGRYMAATFNLLRSPDLIWNYVVNNYLLGEDYPAFDLLHWNGDVTNLPIAWHRQYLRDLYRDNKLVEPDALRVDGTPIDLRAIKTPTYIQAGKEDHIAPAESVFKLTEHLTGPVKFMLAGSGHIAGVVNPPAAKKYQYWTNDGEYSSLEDFRAGATEHPGSWWPDWLDWLGSLGDTKVKANGKRKPGGRGDKVIEDAPGRYVKMR